MSVTEAGPYSDFDSPAERGNGEPYPVTAPLITVSDPRIRDVLMPLGPLVRAADGVEDALQLLARSGVDYVTVTDDGNAPLGLITRNDVDHLQRENPHHWADMRCGNVIVPPGRYLHPDDSFNAAVDVLRDDGVRPLLILDGTEMVGVLAPSAVFQWCAEHRPSVLEELAYLANRTEFPESVAPNPRASVRLTDLASGGVASVPSPRPTTTTPATPVSPSPATPLSAATAPDPDAAPVPSQAPPHAGQS